MIQSAQWVKRLARRRELSPESYAMFVDRVRVNEGRKQLYGSQFKVVNGRRVLQPTVDPAHLDVRRKAIGLIPEEDYQCILNEVYDGKQLGGNITVVLAMAVDLISRMYILVALPKPL